MPPVAEDAGLREGRTAEEESIDLFVERVCGR